MKKKEMGLALLGAAITVGFFLPWIDVGGALQLSGWDLVRDGEMSGITRALLLLCPLLGAGLALSALSRPARAAGFALGTGGAIVGYTIYKVAYGFLKVTGIGLWMVLAAALIALLVGLVARAERR